MTTDLFCHSKCTHSSQVNHHLVLWIGTLWDFSSILSVVPTTIGSRSEITYRQDNKNVLIRNLLSIYSYFLIFFPPFFSFFFSLKLIFFFSSKFCGKEKRKKGKYVVCTSGKDRTTVVLPLDNWYWTSQWHTSGSDDHTITLLEHLLDNSRTPDLQMVLLL
jgi:hypothetical protein